jgi:hypothetical protein
VIGVIRTSYLYEACHTLFSSYPLAATAASDNEAVRSMVLMLRDGDDARFFVLSQDSRDDRHCYSLRRWRSARIADIDVEDGAVPNVVVDAVTQGVPLPDDRSLFGWRHGDTVTALVAVSTTYTPACPEPCWAVMPLADAPEAQWPPFTDECLFGFWFWEHLQTASIVSVSDLIARNPNTVFWVDTEAILGSDCCAVAHDIESTNGPTLQRGRYVYSDALRADKPVPPLSVLLTDSGKTDMASQFQLSAQTDPGLRRWTSRRTRRSAACNQDRPQHPLGRSQQAH